MAKSASIDSLLGDIETFCRSAGVAESTFGRKAANDGKLCARLRDGRSVTLQTAEKIRRYIEKHGSRNNSTGPDAAPVAELPTRVSPS